MGRCRGRRTSRQGRRSMWATHLSLVVAAFCSRPRLQFVVILEGVLDVIRRKYLVPGIRITSRTLWTTTNKLEAGPAAKGRDNEGQMSRSHVSFFGLVATCDVRGTCPTQKLPLFLKLIQMGPRKSRSRISEIPRPGRYRTNVKLKNRKI